MDKNKRLTVWLPVIIAASIALGIFIGNHYLSISQGKKRSYSSGNKINAILTLSTSNMLTRLACLSW